MRIGCIRHNGHLRVVAGEAPLWHDLTDALQADSEANRAIFGLIAAGRLTSRYLAGLVQHAPTIPEPLRFELPLIPSKIVCVGRNYAEHVKELGNALPDDPVLFNKTPNTYLADGGAIRIDPTVGRVEHEGEIGLVIGPAQTVAGYTLLNDVTAREMQAADKAKGLPWFRAKNLNTFCPFGPVVRLADSLPNPPNLDLEVRVNGTLRQRGNTRQFLFTIEVMIEYINRYITLDPGDIVATGTPPGVGALVAGDRVEVSCPEIGNLCSEVALKY